MSGQAAIKKPLTPKRSTLGAASMSGQAAIKKPLTPKKGSLALAA